MIQWFKRLALSLANIKISFNAYLIFSFAFLAIVPIIVCTYVYYIRIEKVIGDDAVKFSQGNLGYISANLDKYLSDLDDLCSEVMLQSDVIDFLRKNSKDTTEEYYIRKQLFTGMQNLHISRNFHSILIYPQDGFMFAYGAFTESNMDNFKKYSVYKDAIDHWGDTIFAPLHVYMGEKPIGNSVEIFSIAKSLKDKISAKMLGVIEITFEEKDVSDIIKASSSSKANRIFLVSDDRMVVAGTDATQIGSILPEEYEGILDGNESGKQINTAQGRRLIVVNKLQTTNWKLVEEIEYEKLIESATNLKSFFVLIIIIVAALSAFIIFIAILVLSKSNKAIVKVIDRIKSGDLTAKTGRIRFKEFAYIGQNMNEMGKKIAIQIENAILDQKLKRDLEFKMLQAQIAPHFLYNALYSISCMAKNRNYNDIATSLDALIMLLKMAVSVKKEILTIREELELLECFIVLERIRSNNKFSVTYRTNPDLMNYQIPKMVLQPIVENCIMHGFVGEKANYEIKITIQEIGDDILIKIYDNGEGMDLELDDNAKKSKFSGIGIGNVDQKIKLYFGERYGISILSEKGEGTLISILIAKNLKDGV